MNIITRVKARQVFDSRGNPTIEAEVFCKEKSSKVTTDDSEKKNYKAMKVAELKAELKEKGLSTSGKKAELIKRLEN